MTTTRVAADTYPRQAGIKIAGYTFDITLNDANNEFVVQETVDVRFVAAGVTSVDLDLCQFSAQPRSPQAADQPRDPCAGAVRRPRQHRRHAAVRWQGDDRDRRRRGRPPADVSARSRSRARHPAARLPARRARFDSRSTITACPRQASWSRNNKYGDRGFFSNPWPNKARNYLASLDHPSAKAPVTTIVTAPRRYQVISNGRLTEADRPAERSAPHRLDRIEPGLHLSHVARRGAVRGRALRRVSRHSAVGVGLSAGERGERPGLQRIHPADPGVLHRSHRAVLVREARPGAGQRHRRRHGARLGHLLRLRRDGSGPTVRSRTRWRTSGSATRRRRRIGTMCG